MISEKRGLYKLKRETTKDLANYFLSQEHERNTLIELLKKEKLGTNRRAMRSFVCHSLWYRASRLYYGRAVASQLVTLLIDEVIRDL